MSDDTRPPRLQAVTTEDLNLAQAAPERERDLRRREWEGLESRAIPSGGGLEDLYDLPPKEALAALNAANACRWIRPGA